jgi:hypothetical protein
VFGLDRPLAAGVSAIPAFVSQDEGGYLVEGSVQIMSDRKTIAFISTTPFAPNTKYRLVLRKSTSGLPLVLYSFVFITREETTNTGPFLMSTTPMDGNINVSRDIVLSNYWSEPLDGTSLGSSSVSVLDSLGNQVSCAVHYDPFWHRLDIIPNANLGVGTQYTVTLSSGIKNLRGQTIAQPPAWRFTTIGDPLPIPVSGPYVTTITPTKLAENISTESVVEVTWNGAMDAATLNSTTCKLVKAWNGEEIPTTLSYSSANSRLTITPQGKLAENTAYILHFTDGVKNAAGLVFSQHAEWEGYFRTGIEGTEGVPVTPDPGWENPGPGGPGIGFPVASP